MGYPLWARQAPFTMRKRKASASDVPTPTAPNPFQALAGSVDLNELEPFFAAQREVMAMMDDEGGDWPEELLARLVDSSQRPRRRRKGAKEPADE